MSFEEFNSLPKQLQGIAENNYNSCLDENNNPDSEEVWDICVKHMVCLHEKEKAEAELAAEREKRQELIKVHEGLHSSFECLLSDFKAEKAKLDEAIRRVEEQLLDLGVDTIEDAFKEALDILKEIKEK